MVGAAIREPMSRRAAVVAGTGLQSRLEEHDHASQSAARLFRNGQARHAMRVESPARFFNRLGHTTTHVVPGDDTDRLEAFSILNHRLCSRRILRGTARRRFDRFHHIATITHFLFFLLDLHNDSFSGPQYTVVLEGFQVHRHWIRALAAG